MTVENKLITLAAVRSEFTSILCKEIDRIKKGGKWEWNENGVHTKLLIDEARKLVRSKAYQFSSLSLDQANAMAILAQYPEALDQMTIPSTEPLRQAIVHAAEEVILDQVFTDEHEAIVLQQWAGSSSEDIMAFLGKAVDDYERRTRKVIDHRPEIVTVDDFDKVSASLFEFREALFGEDDDEHGDDLRRADEFLEFCELVTSGAIPAEYALGKTAFAPKIG